MTNTKMERIVATYNAGRDTPRRCASVTCSAAPRRSRTLRDMGRTAWRAPSSSKSNAVANLVGGVVLFVVLAGGVFGCAPPSDPGAQQNLDAIAFKSEAFAPDRSRGLYVQIRSRQLALQEVSVVVHCALDGAGEVLAEFRGKYHAVNGAGRKWKNFWVVARKELIPVNTARGSANAIDSNVSAVIDAGLELCPTGPISGMASRASDAIIQAVRNYDDRARRLGIVIP